MKKFLVVFMLSTFLLSACGNKPAATTSEDTTAAEQSSEATTEETTEAESTEAEESTDAAETSAAGEVSRGIWDGNVYTNTFAGITFTKPESWLVASDEEMENIFNTGLDVVGMDNSEQMKRLLEMKVIADMMVQNPTTNSNLSIQFENLSLAIGGMNMTEDQYLDINREQLIAIPSMNYEVDTAYYDIELSGNTYRAMDAVLVDMNMTQYFCVRKEGKYMIALTFTVIGDDTIEEFLGYFS